jgi:hypothetical protein
VDGYESSSANGLPPSFLEAWGKALPIEKQLTRAKMGARLERLAGALGFAAAQVLGVKLALFRVTART